MISPRKRNECSGTDLSDLAAPLVRVEESPQPMVMLVWENPASGIIKATDTFLFNDAGKIIRQNVVVQSASAVHLGWNNHFAAFATQDVPRVLLGYTEQSQIIVYDMVSGDQFVYNGLAGVSDAFTGLFAELTDLSDLAAPVVRVEAGFDVLEQQVFLMWENPASGIWKATDTFAFTTDGKIIRQNVVLLRSPSSPFFVDRVPSTLNLNTASTGGPTQAGWDNHFAAFGGQNLQQILLDYVQQSQVVVFDIRTGVESVHHALNGVVYIYVFIWTSQTPQCSHRNFNTHS